MSLLYIIRAILPYGNIVKFCCQRFDEQCLVTVKVISLSDWQEKESREFYIGVELYDRLFAQFQERNLLDLKTDLGKIKDGRHYGITFGSRNNVKHLAIDNPLPDTPHEIFVNMLEDFMINSNSDWHKG